MDTHCPKCRVQLGHGLPFKLNPKCPNCKVTLLRNPHPTEERRVLWFEPKVYVAGLAAFALGWTVSQSHEGALGASLVGMFIYGLYNIFTVMSQAPSDWPRWRIDPR